MAIHFRPTSTARYMVALRYLDGIERPFMVYCDTLADAQKSVNRSLKGMRLFAKAKGAEVRICTSTGKGTQLSADAVKTAALRKRNYLVAAGGDMDLSVILLR